MGVTNHDRLTIEEKEKALELARTAWQDKAGAYTRYLKQYCVKDQMEITRYVNARIGK